MLPGPDTAVQQQTGADSLSQIPIYDRGQIPIYFKRCKENVNVRKISARKGFGILVLQFYNVFFNNSLAEKMHTCHLQLRNLVNSLRK